MPMGKEGKYGSMRFGMQFDDHLGWEGADINYITAPSSGDYFSGTQRFAFGYNEDSGYSLSAGTNAGIGDGTGDGYHEHLHVRQERRPYRRRNRRVDAVYL